MKRKNHLLFLFFIFISHLLFSQYATINGSFCPISTTSCFERVCENQKISFLAGISVSSMSVDSVKWYEQTANVSGIWNSPTLVGNSTTINAPVTENATLGRRYHYTLVLYSGGSPYYASMELDINSLPEPTLGVSLNPICSGSDVLFTAHGGLLYEFFLDSVSQGIVSHNTYSTSTIVSATKVFVKVQNVNGCSATSAPITMFVHPRPDVTSVTPFPTCLGEDMDWTYQGLSGIGPWTVSFWDPTHATKYGQDYIVTNPNGSLNDVPIPYGTPSVHFKIQDNHCPNF